MLYGLCVVYDEQIGRVNDLFYFMKRRINYEPNGINEDKRIS